MFHLLVVLADCGFDHRRKGTPVVTMKRSYLRKLMKVLEKTAYIMHLTLEDAG